MDASEKKPSLNQMNSLSHLYTYIEQHHKYIAVLTLVLPADMDAPWMCMLAKIKWKSAALFIEQEINHVCKQKQSISIHTVKPNMCMLYIYTYNFIIS